MPLSSARPSHFAKRSGSHVVDDVKSGDSTNGPSTGYEICCLVKSAFRAG